MTNKEAIEALKECLVSINTVRNAIKALQEHKTGKWKSNLVDTCSECHALCPTINGERTHTPYCPYCGAKMEIDE